MGRPRKRRREDISMEQGTSASATNVSTIPVTGYSGIGVIPIPGISDYSEFGDFQIQDDFSEIRTPTPYPEGLPQLDAFEPDAIQNLG